MNTTRHIPVLLQQVVHFLAPKPGKILIDCTVGAGGHAKILAELVTGHGKIFGIEADARNLALAKSELQNFPNVHCIHDNFENLEAIGRGILQKEGRIDGILFDLGLSSLHIDEPGRGFSFQRSGPLDMRFDTRQKLTAAEIVNSWPLEQLIFIFKTYGEERNAYRIAKALVAGRRQCRFETTTQLADFIAAGFLPKTRKSHNKFFWKRHPATRIFQSLRIAANRELEVLERACDAATRLVSRGGRVVIISYHSLEDRIVKNIFRNNAKSGILTVLTKKPVVPDDEEIHLNPRSRSAKLRAAEKM